MNPVVHFELPYKDAMRISNFYLDTFNWKLTDLGPNSNNYILAVTCESDAKPELPAGAINGGFFPYKADWPIQSPSIVIGVPNIEDTISKIIFNGGSVLGEPIMIPNFGRYVSFVDTEGNRISIIQPVSM